MRLRSQKGAAVRSAHTCASLFLIVFLFVCGCHDNDDYREYVAPPDADATLIVHAEYETFDVFLDGRRLGRISWTEAYPVRSGQHILCAQNVPELVSARSSGDFFFTIAPDETLNVVVWTEYESRECCDDFCDRDYVRVRIAPFAPHPRSAAPAPAAPQGTDNCDVCANN